MPRPSPQEQVFIEQIQQHQGILHKICWVYAPTPDERKDLYQEIILQLWKSYGAFQGESAFSTWMYRVALNTAITLSKKKRPLEKSLENTTVLVDFEKTLEHSEEVRILYQAIARLSKLEKAVVLMWLEEKSYQEIGDTLGISNKNVSVKLLRTKQKLSKIMAELQ